MILRSCLTYLFLWLVKLTSRGLFWHDLGWVGEVPADRWKHLRVAAILNHTSLFEWLWAGSVPGRFLWQIARHGVVPVADTTMARPLVGRFFGLVARHVVPISRSRDETWKEVLARLHDPQAMVIILPEGRMMRRNGLDKHGKPMTMRGGIADILESMPDGRMLLAYSEGLHHVQAPGERFPRLFQRIRMRFEVVDIVAYRERLTAEAGPRGFKRAVVEDLEARRDRYCRRPEEGRI